MGITANKVRRRSGDNTSSILIGTMPFANIGVLISDVGVEMVNNRKVIPAGTPIGGATSALENEQALLTVTNTASDAADTQGVLMHDTDVTRGPANATMIIFGFVNEFRFNDSLEIVTEAKEVLKNKVTFLRRNQ